MTRFPYLTHRPSRAILPLRPLARTRAAALGVLTACVASMAGGHRSPVPSAAADASPAAVRVVDAKADAQIDVAGDLKRTTIGVHSESGIGRATLQRTGADWPESLVIKLHLRGLESLTVSRDDTTVRWSVSSTDTLESRVSLRTGSVKEQEIEASSPYFSKVQVISKSSQPSIPLSQGHFELQLPRALLKDSPSTVRVEWVDFFRG